MKKIAVLCLAALLVAAALAGCSPKLAGKYKISEVSKLTEKTNALADYEVEFTLRQRCALRDPSKEGSPVVWESEYLVEDAVFKKHSQDDYNRYLFTGRITKMKTGSQDRISREFRMYNDKDRMYTYYDGEYDSDKAFSNSLYAKADKLSSPYYDANNIEQIAIWELSFGKKDYAIGYKYSDTDTTVPQRLYREPEGYFLPSGSLKVEECKAELFMDKNGYLTKQLVTVRIAVTDAAGSGYRNASGTATMDIEIKYVKPGKTVSV